MKVVEIFFPRSVTSVSFLVADIDSAPGVITERVLAEAFDAGGVLLATRSFTAPVTGDLGDGGVILIDFGGVSAVRRLRIANDPVFNPSNRPDIGWGIDDLSFDIVQTVAEPSSGTILGIAVMGFVSRQPRSGSRQRFRIRSNEEARTLSTSVSAGDEQSTNRSAEVEGSDPCRGARFVWI